MFILNSMPGLKIKKKIDFETKKKPEVGTSNSTS